MATHIPDFEMTLKVSDDPALAFAARGLTERGLSGSQTSKVCACDVLRHIQRIQSVNLLGLILSKGAVENAVTFSLKPLTPYGQAMLDEMQADDQWSADWRSVGMVDAEPSVPPFSREDVLAAHEALRDERYDLSAFSDPAL